MRGCGMACCTHQRDEKRQEIRAATVRARELGFLPNEQLWSLAMNKEDRKERGATDGMSWNDVSLSPGAGAVTRASHRALQARGAALLAERPLQPGDEAVNRLQLAACGARSAHGWLRLSPDDQWQHWSWMPATRLRCRRRVLVTR